MDKRWRVSWSCSCKREKVIIDQNNHNSINLGSVKEVWIDDNGTGKIKRCAPWDGFQEYVLQRSFCTDEKENSVENVIITAPVKVS
jgi:hypothetical protein